MIEVDVLDVIKLLQNKMTWIVQNIATLMLSGGFPKTFKGNSIVQILTRMMPLDTSVDLGTIADPPRADVLWLQYAWVVFVVQFAQAAACFVDLAEARRPAVPEVQLVAVVSIVGHRVAAGERAQRVVLIAHAVTSSGWARSFSAASAKPFRCC